MSLLITADLHLTDNSRDAYRHKFMIDLPMRAKLVGATGVVILGDLTEIKDRHSAWLVNKIVTHIVRLAKQAPVLIVRGNHDYVDEDNPFYRFVQWIEGVAWVNAPTLANNLPTPFKTELQGGLILPHTTNYKRAWKGFDVKRAPLVLAHQTFTGADVGFGRKLEGIPMDVLNPNGTVISGDIHVPQLLAPCLEYVGAPYTIDFGDDYEPRVFLLRNQKQGHTVESLPVDGPQKRLVDCAMGVKPSSLPRFRRGDILKVRVKVPAKSKARLNEFKDEVHAWAERNELVIHTIVPVFEKGSIARRQGSSKTDEQLVETYAKARSVDAKKLRVGLNLMRWRGGR